MLPQAVINRQITGQPVVPLLGDLENNQLGSFVAEHLDKIICLAVGARCVKLDLNTQELLCIEGLS
jgi:hypothetical protein